MTKKDYLQPEMTILEADLEQQLLIASVTSVSTTGLGDDDELELPSEGLPKSGSVWDDAW